MKMRKSAISVFMLLLFATYSFALPSKQQIYKDNPRIAKEIKKVLSKEKKKDGTPKSCKVSTDDIDIVVSTGWVPLDSQNIVEIWNMDTLTVSFWLNRVGINVERLDFLVSDPIISTPLFYFHADPRTLDSFMHPGQVPLVVNQDFATSYPWNTMANNFYFDENGQLYSRVQVELVDPNNNPFINTGITVQRDMLDGQGLRNHYLSALRQGYYFLDVKVTLRDGTSYTVRVDSFSVDGITAVSQNKKEDIKVYSSLGKILVEAPGIMQAEVAVYDISGRKLSSGKLKDGKTTINMFGKATGVYMVNIKSKDINFTKKVIIK